MQSGKGYSKYWISMIKAQLPLIIFTWDSFIDFYSYAVELE